MRTGIWVRSLFHVLKRILRKIHFLFESNLIGKMEESLKKLWIVII